MRSTASTKSKLFEVAFLFFAPGPDWIDKRILRDQYTVTAFCEVGGFEELITLTNDVTVTIYVNIN